MLISTLHAYFAGQKDLFEGLAVEQLEKEWTVHPVLHLDLNVGEYQTEDDLRNKLSISLANGRNYTERVSADPPWVTALSASSAAP